MAVRGGFGLGSQSGRQAPGTMILVIAIAIGLLFSFIFTNSPVLEMLQLSMSTPWALATYSLIFPIAGSMLFFALFEMLWLWYAGNAVEPLLGKIGMILHFVFFQILFGLLYLVLSFTGITAVADVDISLSTPYLPIAAMTVLWAAYSPNSIINLFCILPVRMLWIGLFTTAAVIFSEGQFNPIYGVLMGLPLGLAWLYGLGKIPGFSIGKIQLDGQPKRRTQAKRETKEWDEFYSKVRDREKDREEKDRLRKIFESSMDEDSNDSK